MLPMGVAWGGACGGQWKGPLGRGWTQSRMVGTGVGTVNSGKRGCADRGRGWRHVPLALGSGPGVLALGGVS